MNDTLMYFLKVNIAIALFYLFYRLFFAGDTFWKTRRYYLLFSIFISFTYPFLSIEHWLETQESVKAIVVNYALLPEFTVTSAHKPILFSVENVALTVYGLGILILLIRFFIQLLSIIRIRLKGKKQIVLNTPVIVIDKEITPFSFFSSVFINPALHNEHETREILAHELTHVRQGHSFDVLLSELVSILFWFNPAIWLLKREMRQNLEFLADDKVIESGFDSKAYQYHLLQLSYQTPEAKLGNKFNVAPLKKRIIMMNQQKTNKARLLKYSLIIPLALALVISSNAQTVVKKMKKVVVAAQDSTVAKINAPKPIIKTTMKFTAPVIKKDKKVYDVVEKMPVYPGGFDAMLKYLAENIKYPVEAQKNGVEGKIFVRFVVNAVGNVEKTEIIKSDVSNVKVTVESVKTKDEKIANALEQEALRVVNAMPQWTPGEQKGEKVAVYYTLPIQFALDGGEPSVETSVSNGLTKTGIKVTRPTIKRDGETPLYVLDGKEIAEPDFKALKPDNIQSVNVLKGESAIKAYGDKGKNGVILITLKK